jgi:DNA-binding MarR family transcriptional regulator
MAGFILLLQVTAGMGLPGSHNAGSISDWQYQSMVMPADPCYSRAVRPEPEAGKTSTPAALRHRQTYQLARLAAVVRGLCAKHLASAGLRQHQHAILCCLAEFGPECQSDIAARLRIDSGDMVAFVDDLERAGLVSRHRDERDRRRQILILAPAGSRVLRQAEMLLDQGAATIFAPLDTSETDELYRLMLRVLAHHEPGAWP